jgi:hypothetical protein
MGELGGIWKNKQMDLLDKHLKLLKDYSQAKQNLQQYSKLLKKPKVDTLILNKLILQTDSSRNLLPNLMKA